MLSFSYEKRLFRQGFKQVAGIDEAGRGPLAGPIVAAAVIFPPDICLPGLDDSKKLTPSNRTKLFGAIKKKALSIGIAVISHKVIDEMGVGKANQLVMQIAFEKLKVIPDYLLLDGKYSKIKTRLPQNAITGGDRKVASIAAASIIAKVTRDRLMLEYHVKYPAYRFDLHKGYGTELHFKLLYQLGPCAIHRRSFFPVSELA
jgi:ribonuclease HII